MNEQMLRLNGKKCMERIRFRLKNIGSLHHFKFQQDRTRLLSGTEKNISYAVVVVVERGPDCP